MARVGIDLDGVVYDFVESLREYLQERSFVPMNNVGEAVRWEFYEDWGLSRGSFLRHCSAAVEHGYVFTRGEPSEGAVEALKAIRAAGHKLIIVTDRGAISPKAREATISWLRRVGIEYDELHLTGDKATVNLDYFVDDRLENYDALDAAGVKVFLWNQRWNSDNTKERRRVGTWDEYLFVLGVRSLDDMSPTRWLQHASDSHPLEFVNEEVRVTSSTGGQKGTKPARFDLIPWPALWKVAELYGKGAEKYADHNWRKGYDWSLSYAAMQRHASLFWSGEDIDPETGCPHMASVAFHALSLLTFMDEHPEFDNRFKGASDE